MRHYCWFGSLMLLGMPWSLVNAITTYRFVCILLQAGVDLRFCQVLKTKRELPYGNHRPHGQIGYLLLNETQAPRPGRTRGIESTHLLLLSFLPLIRRRVEELSFCFFRLMTVHDGPPSPCSRIGRRIMLEFSWYTFLKETLPIRIGIHETTRKHCARKPDKHRNVSQCPNMQRRLTLR